MIGFLRCLLFEHKWEIIKTSHYYDTSYGEKVDSTMIIKQCARCKKL